MREAVRKSAPSQSWLSRLGRVVLLLAVLAAVLGTTGAATAQQGKLPIGTQWSVPLRIPGFDNEAFPPYLIADQNRTIHSFASVSTGQFGRQLIIVYSQWTLSTGWTNPVDVLLSPWKETARIMGAFLDDEGWVHVIFFGGDELQAAIFYAKAPLMQAGIASAWTRVEIIGEHAIAPSIAAIDGDGKGNLYVTFSGDRDGPGLYAIYSKDSGETWSEPVVVWLTRDETSRASGLRMLVDPQGTPHVVWSRGSERGLGEEVYYSQLGSDRVWTNPLILAERTEGDYKADWPSITSHNGELFLVYQDSSPATRWMRRSFDNGRTWTDPVRPFNFTGEYSHVDFVVDSSNYLHMLLGNRTLSDIHGMWHSVWLGDRWSELEPIISGPKTPQFDPSAPRATISQGNTIMVTWWTDTGGTPRNGVWYSYTVLNTPELEMVPLPTPKPEPTPTPWAVQSQIGNSQQERPQLPFQADGGGPPTSIQSPALVIVAALISSTLFILGVIFIFRNRLQSRS